MYVQPERTPHSLAVTTHSLTQLTQKLVIIHLLMLQIPNEKQYLRNIRASIDSHVLYDRCIYIIPLVLARQLANIYSTHTHARTRTQLHANTHARLQLNTHHTLRDTYNGEGYIPLGAYTYTTRYLWLTLASELNSRCSSRLQP